MELTFEKIGDWYISEFEVTSDFNLHIEREPKGDFYLYQRTSSSGQYDIIEDFGYKKGGDNVIDLDFQALVYPKWIKIKSAVKPLVATITTDGEVNEVAYQAKDIEITSNGTTKVTADTGYTALASVNVKVNVPQSGGGESVSSWKYYDVKEKNEINTLLTYLAISLKGISNDRNILGPAGFIKMQAETITHAAIDFNQKIRLVSATNISTIEEMLTQQGAPLETATEITKEEFYNLNA